MKTPRIAPDRAARAASGRSRKPKRGQEPILVGNGERPVIPTATPMAISNPPPFSHSLQDFWNTRKCPLHKEEARFLRARGAASPSNLSHRQGLSCSRIELDLDKQNRFRTRHDVATAQRAPSKVRLGRKRHSK